MENEHSSNAINFYLITGSGTAGGNENPCFTMIEYDEEYMVPINIHTYYVNLTEANAQPDLPLKWVELHDMVKEYQLEDLRPNNMKKLA